jgi:hypothetical protein
MDNDEQKKDLDLEITPEEQKAEQEFQKEVSEDEIRSKIAEELGIDPEEQSELFEKLVEREKAHREKLSGAIKQKISWRAKALKASEKPKENPEEGKTQIPDIESLIEKKLQERLEARELEQLDLPDELKAEVKDLARLKGISVREAAQLPYIRIRKEEIEREELIKKATPKRSNKGSYSLEIDPSKPLNPEDFDFSTEEGVKAWREAKAARARYLAKNK